MTEASQDNLLARLAGQGNVADPEPWAAVAASKPRHAQGEAKDAKLDELLDRIRGVTKSEATSDDAAPATSATPATTAAPASSATAGDDAGAERDAFMPVEPKSLLEAQLTPSNVEGLILKLM